MSRFILSFCFLVTSMANRCLSRCLDPPKIHLLMGGQATWKLKQVSWVALANDREDFGQLVQVNKHPGLLRRTIEKILNNRYKQTSFLGCFGERQRRFQTTGTSKQASWVALANGREDFKQPVQADKLPGLFARRKEIDKFKFVEIIIFRNNAMLTICS